MTISSKENPDIIELEKGDVLTVASTYESIKLNFMKAAYKSIKLKVYNNYFVIILETDKYSTKKVFSDTWDFGINVR